MMTTLHQIPTALNTLLQDVWEKTFVEHISDILYGLHYCVVRSHFVDKKSCAGLMLRVNAEHYW